MVPSPLPDVEVQKTAMGPHLAWLDSLRALAALWVVAHHAFLTVDFEPRQRLTRVLWTFLMRGHFAVTAFIAISGFSLALSPSRHGWRLRNGYREYLASRWMRIVPAYYASIALALALIATVIGHKTGTHWDLSIPVDRRAVVAHLLMLQDFVGGGQINHVYWSIAVESQIYLVFGLILWGMRRAGYVGTAGTALAVFASLLFLHRGFGRLAPSFATDGTLLIAPYVVVFAFGVCACRIYRDALRPVPLLLGLPALLLMAVSLRLGPSPGTDLAFGLGFAAFLALAATNERLASLLAARPLPQLGKTSYSLYLVHAPFLQVLYVLAGVWQPHGSALQSVSFVVAGLAFSIPVGWGFYLGVERPFDRLRHFARRTAPTGA